MAESGIPQELQIPANADGTGGFSTAFKFNETLAGSGLYALSGGYMQITNITGLDGASIRNPVTNLPQKSGALAHKFYRGARYFTLEGRIVPTSFAGRTLMEDALRGATERILQHDGRYLFTPSGLAQRFLTVRLSQPLEIHTENPVTKTFQMPLVAYEPVAYTATQNTTDIANGVTSTLTNGGNAESWPVFKIYGPWTSCAISNVTTSRGLVFTSPGISSGDYAEVSTYWETVYKNGNQDNLFNLLDPQNPDFFPLVAGGNSINFTATGGSGLTKLRTLYNDAWV